MNLMIFEKKSDMRNDEAERIADVYDDLTTDEALLFHDLTEQSVDSFLELINVRASYLSENGASTFHFFLQVDRSQSYIEITHMSEEEIIDETVI